MKMTYEYQIQYQMKNGEWDSIGEIYDWLNKYELSRRRTMWPKTKFRMVRRVVSGWKEISDESNTY